MTRIRGSVKFPSGGEIFLVGFPGLEITPDGKLVIDPESLQYTVAKMSESGVRVVVLLPEQDEIPPGGFEALRAALKAEGLSCMDRPIPDFSFPDAAFRERWTDDEPGLIERLEKGQSVAFICQHGAGRSGVMTAWMLIRAGFTSEDAITAVRHAFDEAVETEKQVAWLTGQGSAATA